MGRTVMQGLHDPHKHTKNSSQGAAVSSGTVQASRLLSARLRLALTDAHLVPRPRGAFSDLAAVPLDGRALTPSEVGL